jgi:hypothetical protein
MLKKSIFRPGWRNDDSPKDLLKMYGQLSFCAVSEMVNNTLPLGRPGY